MARAKVVKKQVDEAYDVKLHPDPRNESKCSTGYALLVNYQSHAERAKLSRVLDPKEYHRLEREYQDTV